MRLGPLDAGADLAIPTGVTKHAVTAGEEILVGCDANGSAATLAISLNFDFRAVNGVTSIPGAPLVLRPGRRSVLR